MPLLFIILIFIVFLLFILLLIVLLLLFGYILTMVNFFSYFFDFEIERDLSSKIGENINQYKTNFGINFSKKIIFYKIIVIVAVKLIY